MNKLNPLLKVAVSFLFACLISFNFVVNQAMATGDFSQSCSEVGNYNSFLIATYWRIIR